MIWKGRELKTIGDLMYKGINKCESPEEAQEFMRQYKLDNPHADENIGYLSGYYSSQEADRIRDWFKVQHPIFGLSSPSPEEAFAKGLEIGQSK
jgi:hypothetical protein